MKHLWEKYDWMGMLWSCACIYFLAPTLDHRVSVILSASFALINIYAAHCFGTRSTHIRAFIYMMISIGTYFILFNDEPWDFFLYGGPFDSSAIPLLVCSMLMTVGGWLLLPNWRARGWYTIITLGLQIPIGLFIGGGSLQAFFSEVGKSIHLFEHYSASLQFWQFEWMITYHLPFYFLSVIYKKQKS